MRTKSASSLLLLALLLVSCAVTDEGLGGIPMKNGHFLREKTFALSLTEEQVEHLERLQKEGLKVYLEIVLTDAQREVAKKHSNKSISGLSVFEGDWSDCACHAHNIASRVAKDRLEVPISYLRTEEENAAFYGWSKSAEGPLPVGIPVAGKPGFVTSPYSPDKGPIDVRHYSRNTEASDPYTGRRFLVPAFQKASDAAHEP
jgi:hypothetical protein